MTDEMKLLRAFIEAQGFDVEEVKDDMYTGSFTGRAPKVSVTVDYKVTKKDHPVFINIESDGAVFIAKTKPDYCSYPTQLKLRIVDGCIIVDVVNKLDEWTEIT